MSKLWWRIIRGIARVCVWAYYSAFRVDGAERIPKTGPVLFVVNHPNALVDAGAILRAVPRPVSFAAKNTLFTMPVVGWMLRGLGAVPVYRPGDQQGLQRRNLKMFSAFTDLFRRGGATAIFPEGVSHLDPELKEVKSGPARIALDSEAEEDFALGLQIVPVGLHYEPRQQFRGEVHVRIGVPFGVADLKNEKRRHAIRIVQERIADSLRPLVLHLENVELESLVRGVADVYAEHQRAQPDHLQPRPKAELVQIAGTCLNHFLAVDPGVVDVAQRKLDRYNRLARRTGVEGEALAGRARPLRAWGSFLGLLAGLVLGLPLFLIGVLTSYLPYRMTDAFARSKSTGDDSVDLPIRRIGAGAVCFGIFWGLLCLLVFLWSRSLGFTAFFFGALVLCAFVARFYAERAGTWKARLDGLIPMLRPGIDRVAHARGDLLEFVNELVRRFEIEQGSTFLPARKVKWHHRVPWRRIGIAILLAAIGWFAFGLRDERIEELPSTPSPWPTLSTTRAAERLETDAKSVAGVLDTLQVLETRMHGLMKDFREGKRDYETPVDDRAVRQVFLTYLTCRDVLFRTVWFYRTPQRARGPAQTDRAFYLSYVAALELCRRGMQVIETFEDDARAVRKLNEGDPVWGLPAGIFDRVRRNLANSDVYDEVAAASLHFQALEAKGNVPSGGTWDRLGPTARGGPAVVAALADRLWHYKWTHALARAERSIDEGRYEVSSFFAGLMSGVRLREGDLDDGLISRDQISWLADDVLEPGDILLQRRNWALTNALLPGFWTHVALYTGSPSELRTLGVAEDQKLLKTLEALSQPDGRGHERVIIEAMAPGVIFSSLEYSVGEADALCVLRPRLPPEEIAAALARALRHHGKPYDFDFDFFSTDRLVCTELVHQAYQGPITIELDEIMGRKTLAAHSLLRKWHRERGRPDAELEMACFLDVDEAAGVARPGNEKRLMATLARPGLTLLQGGRAGSAWPRILLIALAALTVLALLFLRRRG